MIHNTEVRRVFLTIVVVSLLDYVRALKASHPFSALMASSVFIILMARLRIHWVDIIVASVIVILIQLITGMVNDYVDYEKDKLFQPDKPMIRDGIHRDILSGVIMISLGFALLITFWYFTLVPIIVILLGTLIAQSYNIWLKDTPFSILAFDLAFGLLAILPFLLAPQIHLFDISFVFIISGGLIASILHMCNDLVDFEVDKKQGAKPFVVWLGQFPSFILILLFSGGLLLVNYQTLGFYWILIANLLALSLIYSSLIVDKLLSKEISYYLIVICYVVIFILLPLQ